MLQTVIAASLIVLAAAYLGWAAWRTLSGRAGGCVRGCGLPPTDAGEAAGRSAPGTGSRVFVAREDLVSAARRQARRREVAAGTSERNPSA